MDKNKWIARVFHGFLDGEKRKSPFSWKKKGKKGKIEEKLA